MKKLIITILMLSPLYANAGDVINDWGVFRKAIIWVESRGQENAVNGDCVGVLQIRPIYVREANRILKKEVYTLDDRLNRTKSIEMFEIIQRHYNPTKDFNKAIQLHNPTEKTGVYSQKIMNRYDSQKTGNIF